MMYDPNDQNDQNEQNENTLVLVPAVVPAAPPATPPATPPAPPSQSNAALIADWVSRDAPLDEDGERALQDVLTDPREQLKAYIIATNRRDVKRIETLQGYLNRIETRMMSQERIDNTEQKDLVSMHRVVAAHMEKTFERLETRVSGPGLRVNLNDNRSINFEIPDLNGKKSREKVLGVFGAMLKRAAELDVGEGEGERVDSDGSTDSSNQS